MKSYEKMSKFLSLILRHKPEEIGLKLDREGYIKVNELIEAVNKSGRELNEDILADIVHKDSKKRYSFNKGYDKIRANQGHSIKVDLGLPQAAPKSKLYHGTVNKSVKSINEKGLLKGSREHVHLSESINDAKEVGKRRGKPVVYEIDTLKMIKDGYVFYLSENDVWLTSNIPAKYLILKEDLWKRWLCIMGCFSQ